MGDVINRLIIKVSLCILIIYLILLIPSKYNKEFTGRAYTVGEINKQDTEKVNIRFDGIIKKDVFLRKKYSGTINISNISKYLSSEDKKYLNQLDSTEVELWLNKDLSANLSYCSINDGNIKLIVIGNIYFNHEMDKLTIMIFHPEHRGWSPNGGLMITAPADTRDEALIISNNLMQTQLREFWKCRLE